MYDLNSLSTIFFFRFLNYMLISSLNLEKIYQFCSLLTSEHQVNIVDGYSHLPLGHCALDAGRAASHCHITRAAPNILEIFWNNGKKIRIIYYIKLKSRLSVRIQFLVVCISVMVAWIDVRLAERDSYVFWLGEIYFKKFLRALVFQHEHPIDTQTIDYTYTRTKHFQRNCPSCTN